MDFQTLGRILLVIGIVIAVLGLALMLLGRTGIFNAPGNLPGDIRIQGQGFTCVIPIVSVILISLVLTIILNVIIRIINRP